MLKRYKNVKMFFDRRNQRLSIIADGEYIVKRHPARSGQPDKPGMAYQSTSWISGKSPIPYTDELGGGRYYLWTTPLRNRGQFDNKGIGWFYPISSSPNNSKLIQSGVKMRQSIGLHPENMWKGSEGCVVLLWHTPKLKAQAAKIMSFIESLKVPHFELVVL